MRILTVRCGDLAATLCRLADGRYQITASNTLRVFVGTEDQCWTALRETIKTGCLPTQRTRRPLDIDWEDPANAAKDAD